MFVIDNPHQPTIALLQLRRRLSVELQYPQMAQKNTLRLVRYWGEQIGHDALAVVKTRRAAFWLLEDILP